MTLVLLIFAVAACVWGAIFAQRGSLWLGLAAFVAFGYVLGPPLWSAKVGPVALTADRVLLAVLGMTFLWQGKQGKLAIRGWTEFDWLLAATLAYFTLRCALTESPPASGASTAGPWWRLVASFWIPSALYVVARTAPLNERSWRILTGGLTALGLFLALTAYAEVFHQWWAVFPRYISDPTLGTHFGRARGPALNSASLGVNLAICFWAAWLLAADASRPRQLAFAGILTLIAGAVYFTYTRSTWIGLAAALAVIPLIQLPRQWRYASALAVLFVGAVGAIALGEKLTNLSRKDSDASAEHSVYQRESFAVVSARMFHDAPIFGCGFGRFYDKKMPYLADRSQQVELESLRTLDHHNTFLSVLVETGIVGLLLILALLAAWIKAAIILIRDPGSAPWQQRHGLLLLATLITYASSALFHDLTLLPHDQWIMFLAAGAAAALVAERRQTRAATQRQPAPVKSLLSTPTWEAPLAV